MTDDTPLHQNPVFINGFVQALGQAVENGMPRNVAVRTLDTCGLDRPILDRTLADLDATESFAGVSRIRESVAA